MAPASFRRTRNGGSDAHGHFNVTCAAALLLDRPAAPRPRSPPSIRDLAWLEGTWQGRIGERDFEARYSGTDGGQVLVFENLAHDFPTWLSYQRVADNKLTILVSGPGEDGQEQVLTYSLALKR
jgi:hypothetical protein